MAAAVRCPPDNVLKFRGAILNGQNQSVSVSVSIELFHQVPLLRGLRGFQLQQ